MMEAPLLLIGSPADEVEHDCACPVVKSTPVSTAPANIGAWRIAPDLYRAPLPAAHELAMATTTSEQLLVLTEPARAVLNSFSTPRPLRGDQAIGTLAPEQVRLVAERLAAHRLLVPEGESGAQPPANNSDILTVWLHVTNACNLRCSYCYIDKNDETMDMDVGYQAIDAAFRTAQAYGYRAVKLKYAGGEATLNFGLIKALHEHAVVLATRTALELHEVVLSNGVALTSAMLAFLRDSRMRLMISLDGVNAAHDQQRAFTNGRGSLRHVVRTVERAIAMGVTPSLSITVTANNAEQLDAVVEFALDRELRFNLNFFRDNDNAVDSALLSATDDQLIAGVRVAFAAIARRVPQYRLIDGLVDRSAFNGRHSRACGAGQDYMVVDQRGQIARCQMELAHPVTSVAAPNPLHAIRLEQSRFRNLSVDEKEGCRDCAWRYWCGGGCALLTSRTAGRDDVKSPYCDVYKALYPEALYLEGLRLIAWAPSLGVTRNGVERWA